jgi:hypothetical protein
MLAESEINQKILQLIVKIETSYPELVKFLGEMPIKSIHSPQCHISEEELIEYYESLKSVLEQYSIKHTPNQN